MLMFLKDTWGRDVILVGFDGKREARHSRTIKRLVQEKRGAQTEAIHMGLQRGQWYHA